jgi:hypothetical protein
MPIRTIGIGLPEVEHSYQSDGMDLFSGIGSLFTIPGKIREQKLRNEERALEINRRKNDMMWEAGRQARWEAEQNAIRRNEARSDAYLNIAEKNTAMAEANNRRATEESNRNNRLEDEKLALGKEDRRLKLIREGIEDPNITIPSEVNASIRGEEDRDIMRRAKETTARLVQARADELESDKNKGSVGAMKPGQIKVLEDKFGREFDESQISQHFTPGPLDYDITSGKQKTLLELTKDPNYKAKRNKYIKDKIGKLITSGSSIDDADVVTQVEEPPELTPQQKAAEDRLIKLLGAYND